MGIQNNENSERIFDLISPDGHQAKAVYRGQAKRLYFFTLFCSCGDHFNFGFNREILSKDSKNPLKDPKLISMFKNVLDQIDCRVTYN